MSARSGRRRSRPQHAPQRTSACPGGWTQPGSWGRGLPCARSTWGTSGDRAASRWRSATLAVAAGCSWARAVNEHGSPCGVRSIRDGTARGRCGVFSGVARASGEMLQGSRWFTPVSDGVHDHVQWGDRLWILTSAQRSAWLLCSSLSAEWPHSGGAGCRRGSVGTSLGPVCSAGRSSRSLLRSSSSWSAACCWMTGARAPRSPCRALWWRCSAW